MSDPAPQRSDRFDEQVFGQGQRLRLEDDLKPGQKGNQSEDYELKEI